MHRFFLSLLFLGMVGVFIYMVTMPFLLHYNDQTEDVGEVTYYIPEAGLESQFHREVELTKGRKKSEE